MHKKLRWSLSGLGMLLVAVFVSASAFSLFTTGQVSAQAADIERIRFLDADQIRVDWSNGRTTLLRDDDTNDRNFRYAATSNDHSCHGVITFKNVSSGIMNLLQYHDSYPGPNLIVNADLDRPGDGAGSITCHDYGGSVDITVSDFANARNYFRFENSATIQRVDNDSRQVYVRSEQYPNLYFRTNDGDPESDECVDYIEVNSSGSQYRLYDIARSGGGNLIASSAPHGVGCRYNDQADDRNHIYGYFNSSGAVYNSWLPMGNRSAGPDNPSVISDEDREDLENTEVEDTCESLGWQMSWIVCPAIYFADSIVRWLDQEVTDLLGTPASYYEDDQLRTAWSRLRNIAYIILVPIMLVMVIGTALGFDFVSAYTVKRAFPRLLIAVVFIALSYEITKFLVVLTNEIGQGIGGIIMNAFTRSGEISMASIFSPSGSDSIAAGAVFTGALVGALAIGSIGVIFSYLFVAAIALAVGFFLLSLRQMLIVALMILAPVAILSWIFPGNEKLWKLWWGTFSKLLLLFPLVMLLVASGKSFAALVPNGGLANALIKLVAYVGPYFMIPAMFKFAGGAFASIAGMVDNKERGLFDRQRKYRGRKMSENWQDTKTGNKAWRPKTFNTVGRHVGAGAKGRFGLGATGRQAMALDDQANADEYLKNNQRLQKLAFHDDGNAVMALSGGSRAGAQAAARDLFTDENGNYDEARAQRAIAAAGAVGFNRSNARAAMTTLAQNKSRSVAAGERGRYQMQEGINRLAGSAEEAHDLRDSFAYHSFSNGRADLGATSWNNADNPTIAGFDRAGASAVANGHVSGVESTGQALVDQYHAATTQAEQIEAASKLTALRNGIGAHTPEENKRAINRLLADVGVNLNDQQSVDEQFGRAIGGQQGPPPTPPAPLGSSYTAQEKATHDAATRAYQQQLAAYQGSHVTEVIRNRAGLYDQGTGRMPYDPAAQQQQQQGQQGQGGPGNPPQSDRRLKQNIRTLGSVNGIAIYSFNYVWNRSTTYVGVMAQDLLDTHPGAISLDKWGFYQVDYSYLGLRMTTLHEWLADDSSVILQKINSSNNTTNLTM